MNILDQEEFRQHGNDDVHRSLNLSRQQNLENVGGRPQTTENYGTQKGKRQGQLRPGTVGNVDGRQNQRYRNIQKSHYQTSFDAAHEKKVQIKDNLNNSKGIMKKGLQPTHGSVTTQHLKLSDSRDKVIQIENSTHTLASKDHSKKDSQNESQLLKMQRKGTSLMDMSINKTTASNMMIKDQSKEHITQHKDKKPSQKQE